MLSTWQKKQEKIPVLLSWVEFDKWDQNRGQNFRRAIKESLMTLMTDFLEEKGWSSSEEMD